MIRHACGRRHGTACKSVPISASWPAARRNGDGAMFCTALVTFDCGTWASVKVPGGTGTTVEAHGLQGLDVEFTGSQFEPLAFEDTSINGAY
ncbi:hypothetical protein LBW59_13425 [Ralstonia solanacearum]|uniref:Uncharacterized protein n=1 Tax=Ralstonia solanacearum TaxID=305 RepID=A0AAW5ZNY9_RALSL|nr:hypothetical protein [Ralstonia solanacearum]MDB0571766.1 hypothetical protein [Ralstonia solanacearum]